MSDQDNPYSAPRSNLASPVADGAGGSIDNTLAGNADLEFGTALGDAWKLVSGTKGVIIGGFVAMYAVLMVLMLVLVGALGIGSASGSMAGSAMSFLVQMAITAAIYPFLIGVLMIGVKQASGQPFSFNDLLGYYDKTLPLLVVYVLMTLATTLGFLLLIIPGIWLMVATVLAPILVVEKGMNPIDALLTSIKIVNKKWFTVFFLMMVIGLIMGLSIIPLGIGLIWALPWAIMVTGVIYRQLAGVGTPA